MALDISWLGCDLVTGAIVEELGELRPTGPLRRIIGDSQSMTFTLPIPKRGSYGAPAPNWMAATEPGRTMIVCLLAGRPIWAGIVLTRQGGSAALITLGTVTCEGYLARRYVGDHTWTQRDEASVIAAGLIKDAATEGIGLVIDAPPTGKKRDRSYLYKDNKTVMSALTELSGILDPIEWTVDLDWTNADQTAVKKIIRVRKRIGRAAPGGGPVAVYGVSAAAVFDTPAAADSAYDYQEDYSDGRGANHVVTWSTGEGDQMPFSTPAREEGLLDTGWPRWEDRFQPSTSIIIQQTLDDHASQRLALIGQGTRTVELTARADVYPRLGDDWNLGDDIGYELVGHWHPDGLSGQARAVGWELEPQKGTVAPVLLTLEGGFAGRGPDWVENGGFEEGLAGWTAVGSVPPTLAQDNTQALEGLWALRITWGTGGTSPGVETLLDNMVPGSFYRAEAWVWVTAGARPIRLTVVGVGSGPASTVTGTWQLVEFAWTATATSHTLRVEPSGSPTAGQQAWVDEVSVT